MTARSKASPRLPPGLSPSEEALWWAEHREYWDAAEDVDERVAPPGVHRTKPVNLRLPADMVDRLEREAARRSLPFQALLRMWLEERLEAEAVESTH